MGNGAEVVMTILDESYLKVNMSNQELNPLLDNAPTRLLKKGLFQKSIDAAVSTLTYGLSDGVTDFVFGEPDNGNEQPNAVRRNESKDMATGNLVKQGFSLLSNQVTSKDSASRKLLGTLFNKEPQAAEVALAKIEAASANNASEMLNSKNPNVQAAMIKTILMSASGNPFAGDDLGLTKEEERLYMKMIREHVVAQTLAVDAQQTKEAPAKILIDPVIVGRIDEVLRLTGWSPKQYALFIQSVNTDTSANIEMYEFAQISLPRVGRGGR